MAESKDEQTGFHKGSLATLAKERMELMRILGIVVGVELPSYTL